MMLSLVPDLSLTLLKTYYYPEKQITNIICHFVCTQDGTCRPADTSI